MKKIIYTRPEDGGVSVVIPSSKEAIERVLGPLTDEEYSAHVYERSIPEGALNVREIDDEDMPADREFRDAWVDVTEEKCIDIDCKAAKDIQLTKLRATRDAKLDKLDKQYMIALERGLDTTAIKNEKQALRDCTERLKALDLEGVYNSKEALDQIKELGTLG